MGALKLIVLLKAHYFEKFMTADLKHGVFPNFHSKNTQVWNFQREIIFLFFLFFCMKNWIILLLPDSCFAFCMPVFFLQVFSNFFHFSKKRLCYSVCQLFRCCSESPNFDEFLRSLSLPSFSPGIACCLSWINLSFGNCFIYYLNYFTIAL